MDFKKTADPPVPIFLPPGLLHHSGPQVGAKHQLPHQKASAGDVRPAAAEEVQPAKDNDGALVHCHQ